MANLVVCYPKHDGAHFDADYYRDTHIPLVERLWTEHGMTGAEILWPADPDQPFAAMVVLRFRDGAAIDDARGSPGGAVVKDDVLNFTDIRPTIYRTR